jgi:hypothetical protein
MLREGALQRVAPAESFNRRDVGAGYLRERHEARVDRHAIDQDGARAAFAFPAALFGSRQAARLT